MFDQKVRETLNILRQNSLKPGSEINSVLSDFVFLASDTNNDILFEKTKISDSELQELRALCGEAEYELENFWANTILKSKFPTTEMMKFPYYENYRKLSSLEIMSLKSLIGVYPVKMLVIGGGPLPLSAILVSQEYGVKVDTLDNNKEAVDLSKKIYEKLKLTGKSIFSDAMNFTKYHEYDVILLASLVGNTNIEKQEIISYINKQIKEDTAVIVRSAEGARRLLYPDATVKNLPIHFKEQVKVIPKNNIVNSFRIYIKNSNQNLNLVEVDNPESSSIFRQKALQYIQKVYGYTYNPAWHYDLDNLNETYNKPKSKYWLIYSGNEIIGTAAIRPSNTEADTIELWRFFIDQQFEKRTLVSNEIFPRIQEYIKSLGYKKISVHDQMHVPGAITHYLNLGFEVIRESGDEYQTVYMEKKL
jgi:nicotianamine synthase